MAKKDLFLRLPDIGKQVFGVNRNNYNGLRYWARCGKFVREVIQYFSEKVTNAEVPVVGARRPSK